MESKLLHMAPRVKCDTDLIFKNVWKTCSLGNIAYPLTNEGLHYKDTYV